MAKSSNNMLKKLEKQLYREANALFKTDEYMRFFGTKLTRERARFYMINRATFVLGRRACWAYVQARAPFDVKQLIWQHEEDELAGSRERGVADHLTLGIREGKSVGLTKRDFTKAKPCEGSLICSYAWQHAADRLPWLAGAALLGGLEIANADGIIKGGGMSHRMAYKLRDELGIPFSRQPSNQDHMDVEDEHSKFIMIVADRHMKTKDDYDAIMHGARTTWAINKTWLRLMTVEMQALPNR
jgi:pyrroloquinoline quinone (PQQ) biosynthesis protein C